MQEKKITEGEADFLTSLRLCDSDPNTYFNRGKCYLDMGYYPQAIADFNDVLRLRPEWRIVARSENRCTEIESKVHADREQAAAAILKLEKQLSAANERAAESQRQADKAA